MNDFIKVLLEERQQTIDSGTMIDVERVEARLQGAKEAIAYMEEELKRKLQKHPKEKIYLDLKEWLNYDTNP